MNSDTAFSLEPQVTAAGGAASPCGCGGSGAPGAAAGASDAELRASLDAALASLEGAGNLGFDSGEMEIAALDAALDQAEMLDPFAEAGAGGGLEEMVALLERYPGLKVTLSF
jgi:hypothetical protein